MTTAGVFARLVWRAVVVVGLGVIVAQHVGYFRKRRPLSFGAFLETTGWIIITSCAIGALGGGLARAGTRAVETAAAIVGLAFLIIGGQFR